MLKKLYDIVRRLLVLNEETARNKNQLDELRQEVKGLSAAVRELAFEVRRF